MRQSGLECFEGLQEQRKIGRGRTPEQEENDTRERGGDKHEDEYLQGE